MDSPDSDDEAAVLAALAGRGPATSVQLQALLGRSQATLSRLLQALAPRLVILGAGRRTRYAVPTPILGLPAQQPLYWVNEDAAIERWGSLTFVAGNRVHVQAPDIELLSHPGALPWFLSPLRGEGYLGRALARRLAANGLADSPERWPLEHVLFAALQTPDPPGAITLGEPTAVALPALDHDAQADALIGSVPGSSAGGEQAKFLARREHGQPVLVKFSPPRGTPFGERWHDLLHAEAMALAVLQEVGVPVAVTRMVLTKRRTYLESARFDRTGAHGRRHAVPLHAVHEAFVPGDRQHWAATCEALVRQHRLPPGTDVQVRALMQFGRLIGNTDMHFGNLSLHLAKADVARGRFTLAPVYDMLPMRWRPDIHSGELGLLPFTPEPIDLQSPARAVAQVFWQRAADHGELGAEFRALARTMLSRIAQ